MGIKTFGKQIVLTIFFMCCVGVLLTTNSESLAGTSEILSTLTEYSRLRNREQLLAPLREPGDEIKVIVGLRRSARAKALSTAASGRKQSADTPSIYNLKDKKIKQELRKTVAADLTDFIRRIPPENVTIRKRFQYTFGFAATVTAEGLEELLAQPDLVSISEDILLHPHTSQGISLMKGTAPRSNYDGTGISIAIVDTGIDTAHPKLGGSINFPNDKVIGGYDFGDNDDDPRPNPVSGEAHGTACAGIAAGDRAAIGDYIGGVAPGARLYSLKITEGDGGAAYASSMIAAWEWCVTHQYDNPDAPLLLISTSFGGGHYTSECDSEIPEMTQTAANAVAAGITLFASAGNEGYCNAMSWPACISSINSVGAVYDDAFGIYLPCVSPDSCADKIFTTGCGDFNYYAADITSADMVPSYSNSASFLTFFAPSNMAYTTDIVSAGGYSSDDYLRHFGGTSASSPYAAGAAAILQHAVQAKTGNYLSPEQVKNYLATYGTIVTDSKAAVSKPRIDLENIDKIPYTTATYTITSSSMPNGTITPSGILTAAKFDTLEFFIQADSGYTIKEVLIDSISIGAVDSYTFSSLTADHTITASFEAVPEKSFSWWLPFIITLSGKKN